jgi:hypothetical protein
MATSGSTDYQATRDSLITGALRLVGGVAQGETPTSSQISEAAEALNMMIKAWIADGMPLWAIKKHNFALTSGTNNYTIGTSQTINTPKPLKIIQAFLRNTTSSVDTPMEIVTKQEYWDLGNKSSTGLPIQLMYDPNIMYGTIYLFPTPDSVAQTGYQVHIIYQRPFEDFDASTDTPDFPQEWTEAIKYGLAVRLAGEYGMPVQDRRQLIQEAVAIKSEALSFGTEEGSLYFQRESQN